MSKASFIFWFLLVLSAICFSINVYQGWNLSQVQAADASNHLSIGIVGILCLWIGSIGLFRSTQFSLKIEARSKAVSLSFGACLLSVLSILSGTISHAGQLPILHGSLACVLIVLIIVAAIRWLAVGRSNK